MRAGKVVAGPERAVWKRVEREAIQRGDPSHGAGARGARERGKRAE